MKLSWRDMITTTLALFGAVVVFAKLQSYSWVLIGSWKGALGVIGVIGLAIFGIYLVDWFRNEDTGIVAETSLWIIAATVIVGSLFTTTTKAEFVWSAVLIGLSWLAQVGSHAWDTTHSHSTHYVHS